MGSTNLAYSEKVNLQVSVELSFQGLPSFLGKEKLAKWTYFATRHFVHPSLIFATHCSILSFALVCLAKVCQHSLLPIVMKDPLLIVKVILRRWSVKTLILCSLDIKTAVSMLQISETLGYY